MNYEQAAFFVSIAVLAMQAWNLYMSATLKLWAYKTFVSKSDFLDTIEMWSKFGIIPKKEGAAHEQR
jgi:hypothetical protein